MSERRKHKTQKPPLSAQDVRFARLLFDRGATKKTVVGCYVEAGFPESDTPANTVAAAHRRVKNRHFREYYRKLQDRAAAAAQLDANMVVQGFMRIAFADRADLFDETGRLLPKGEWPADVAATVEGVETEEPLGAGEGAPARVRKVRTAPRTEALKALAQILRLVGKDAAEGKSVPAPLVVGGEANPDAL